MLGKPAPPMELQMSVHTPVLDFAEGELVDTDLVSTSEPNQQPNQQPTQHIDLLISPRAVAKLLFCVVAVLATVGTIADFLIFRVFGGREHKLSRLLNRIDLGFEPSVPAFYSSFALLAAAGLLALISIGEKQRGGRHVWHWGILAILFAGMSLDEMVMLHELFVNSLRDSFDLHGVFLFSWVIPGMITVAVVGFCYLGFLFRLDARTRKLFIIAAVLFVGGALGMEMIAGILVESHGDGEAGLGSPSHIAAQTVEETCEMLGIVVFVYALLCYIENQWGSLKFQLRSPE